MNHITIDPERVVSDIDRNVFGGYLEIGFPDIDLYVGLYSPDSPLADKDGLRSDVKTALARMKFPNARFPGGNFTSGYRWIDGVGPLEERPTRRELAWNSIMPNEFGTNEFIRFCRKMNIEPFLCANCGDGDIREAADWVEYCNGTANTYLANLRRKHGFTEPHKVKYWGIGNEVDGHWQIGYKSPQEYARAVTEFSKVMKWTDPEIKLVASATSFWEDNPFHMKTEWVERAQLILEQAGDHIDYLAIHRYAHPRKDDPFETYMAFAEDFNERLSAYEGLIHAVSLERGLKHAVSIAVDEWGLMRLPSGLHEDIPISVITDKGGIIHLPSDSRDIPRPKENMIINLEDALITALYLNAFIRHANSVRLANFTFSVMAIGILNYERGRNSPVLLQTNFFPFELYSHTCGSLALDVFWNGETFSGTYNSRTYRGIRTLDVAATLDQTHKQVVVYVVNQNKEEAQETTISLTSGQFTGKVREFIINGPDIKSENTDEKPNQVGVREVKIDASGKSFILSFEPHSVTALVCPIS